MTMIAEKSILRRLYAKQIIKIGEMEVVVYVQMADATCEVMFRSLSMDLDSLCFTKAQIDQFCEEQKDILTKGCTTFFLFKKNGGFFVTCVTMFSSGQGVRIDRLEDDFAWRAEDRYLLVVPQPNS